jgi:hypothetical protein
MKAVKNSLNPAHMRIIYSILPQFSPQCKVLLFIINELQSFSLHCLCVDGAGHGGWRPGGAYPDVRIAPLPRYVENGFENNLILE